MSKKITITLTEDQWELISDAADSCEDEGPRGEGWQSPELSSACATLETQIAEGGGGLPLLFDDKEIGRITGHLEIDSSVESWVIQPENYYGSIKCFHIVRL